MDELTAIGRARRIVGGLTSAPIDVVALAECNGIIVKESDLLADGEAGNTFRKGEKTYIVVNKREDPYRRRFTVAHELGHHILNLPSHHGPKISSNELERFAGRPPEEKLCDVFAAECLVPWHLIRPRAISKTFSAQTLFELSKLFEASRPCVASTFVRASTELIAYVFSEGGRIQHAIASTSLRAQGIYIQAGFVPTNSAAALSLKSGSLLETSDLDGSDWSSSDAALHFACYEEAVHLQKWQQTLSLITFERVAGSVNHPDMNTEEDELLPELTGHLPWPKR